MGFKLDLLEKNNYIHNDFKDAYWKISNIGIGDQNGIFGVYYKLEAYPSRDASKNEGNPVELLPFGGSTKFDYEPSLYQFEDFVKTSLIFGEGNPIPGNIEDIKTAVYFYIKNTYKLNNAVDVFEDNQEQKILNLKNI